MVDNEGVESIKSKQLFLREEILDKGFDPKEFSDYLENEKGEEKIDLEYWSMKDLKKAVESFKDSKLNKIVEKPPEKTLKRRHSSAGHAKKIKNKKKEKEKEKEKEDFGKTGSFKIKNSKILEEKKKIWDDLIDMNTNLDEIDENEKNEGKIKCIKLEENEITNRNDLYIEIKLSGKAKNNNNNHNNINNNNNNLSFLSEIEIETLPIGFKTIRKINDLEYLNKKLPLINSEIYNPVLYIHKIENSDNISNDSIIYLNLYLNSLIQSSYFRTLPIVYDFLTKTEEEWEKIKIEKYDKIKEKNRRNKIPNLNGYFNLQMEAGDDEKCLKINDELKSKKDPFYKLIKNIDEILKLYDKCGSTLKNISEAFGELKNKYMSSPNTTNLFAHLEIIVKVWSNTYITQRQYIKDEFRYFFRYMHKENNSFMKYYDNFKESYDVFKEKFDKMKATLYPSEKDKLILQKLQREFSFKLVNVYGEYKKLNENQAKKIENKLNKISNDRNIIFKDIEIIQGLLNFFKGKKKKDENEKDILTKNKIENKDNKDNKENKIEDKDTEIKIVFNNNKKE